jgi:uncharacterized membrane protein YhhN
MVALALWQQIERFEPGTDFLAGACRVAHFKVLKLRDSHRRRRVQLDDAVAQMWCLAPFFLRASSIRRATSSRWTSARIRTTTC